MCPIVDGMDVNAANTNGQLLDAISDDTALGKLTLANTDVASGTSVTNIQAEHNSAASFIGKTINASYNSLPVWTNNDVGSSTDPLKTRTDAITQKFNSSTGHAHSGAAGDGSPILAANLASVPLKGYVLQAADLTGITGSSTNVSTQLTGKTASSGVTVVGVVVTAPNNKVVLRQATGTNQDDVFLDSFGNVVYGRLTFISSVWTLSFYVNLSGTETAYSFSSSSDIRWYYQELYNPMVSPPTYSEYALIPSDNVTADVLAATTTTQGKVQLSASTPGAIASTGSAGTANTSVANADHTHAGVSSIAKSGSSAILGAVTLSGSGNVAATQVSSNIDFSITGQIPIANGGTGQSTQQAAINALTGTQSSGKYLRSDGTNASLSTIQAADVPTLNQNTTGTASNVTGTVAIANGGTGQTTQQAAINALTGTQISGRYLRSDGTNSSLSTIQAADVPTLNQNTTGTASNVTGTVAIANGGTGQTTQQAAINALTGTQSSGKYLRSDGTNSSLTSIQAGDLPLFSSIANGAVGASGGGTTNFLRADGSWAAPAGGGGGGVAAWATATAYTSGQIVSYNKNVYICITGNTSGSTFEADYLLGYWSLLNLPQVQQNFIVVGQTFESGTVGGWTATGVATVTNGLPVSVGSGGLAFSSTNGGRTKGANTSAPAVSSSNPINATYSLNLATTGAGTIGDGYISQSIPLPISAQAKVLAFKLNYKVVSGSPNMSGTSANTYAVAIYDITNNAWIYPAGAFNFIQSSGVGTASGTFQTASNTAAVQVFVYSPVAPTGASSLYLDDFYLGPQVMVQGSAMTDWQSYAVSITGVTSNPTKGTTVIDQGYYRRIGDSIEIRYQYDQTVAGAAGSGTYQFSLPSGITLDSTKFNAAQSNQDQSFGSGIILWTGGTAVSLAVVAGAISNSGFSLQAVNVGPVGSTNGSLGNTAVRIGLEARLPVSGWSSTSAMSSDTDTRVVSFIGNNASTQAVTANVTNVAVTTTKDSHGAWTGSTYVVPVSGDYTVGINSTDNASTTNIAWDLYKNGSIVQRIGYSGTATSQLQTTFIPNCAAGDIISIRSRASVTLAANTYIYIFRLSGPSVIAANELVALRYSGATATITGTDSLVTFTTKDYDTHTIYSSGTSTIGVVGKFRIFAQVRVDATFSAGSNVGLSIYKNGALYSTTANITGGAQGSISAIIDDTLALNPGDTIQIQINSNATTPTVNATANRTRLIITRLGM